MSNNSRKLIGKMYISRFKFFNTKTNTIELKRRPVLIIGVEKDLTPCDITVFPISKVSVSANINLEFDHKLTATNHQKLNLPFDPSYVRTHKVNTIHSGDLVRDICSVEDLYPADYQSIMGKFEIFTNGLLKKSLTQN